MTKPRHPSIAARTRQLIQSQLVRSAQSKSERLASKLHPAIEDEYGRRVARVLQVATDMAEHRKWLEEIRVRLKNIRSALARSSEAHRRQAHSLKTLATAISTVGNIDDSTGRSSSPRVSTNDNGSFGAKNATASMASMSLASAAELEALCDRLNRLSKHEIHDARYACNDFFQAYSACSDALDALNDVLLGNKTKALLQSKLRLASRKLFSLKLSNQAPQQTNGNLSDSSSDSENMQRGFVVDEQEMDFKAKFEKALNNCDQAATLALAKYEAVKTYFDKGPLRQDLDRFTKSLFINVQSCLDAFSSPKADPICITPRESFVSDNDSDSASSFQTSPEPASLSTSGTPLPFDLNSDETLETMLTSPECLDVLFSLSDNTDVMNSCIHLLASMDPQQHVIYAFFKSNPKHPFVTQYMIYHNASFLERICDLLKEASQQNITQASIRDLCKTIILETCQFQYPSHIRRLLARTNDPSLSAVLIFHHLIIQPLRTLHSLSLSPLSHLTSSSSSSASFRISQVAKAVDASLPISLSNVICELCVFVFGDDVFSVSEDDFDATMSADAVVRDVKDAIRDFIANVSEYGIGCGEEHVIRTGDENGNDEWVQVESEVVKEYVREKKGQWSRLGDELEGVRKVFEAL